MKTRSIRQGQGTEQGFFWKNINLSFFLALVNRKRFVLQPANGAPALSFRHVDQLIAIKKLLKTEDNVRIDFTEWKSFEPDGKFTVRSGTWKSLADYSNFLSRAKIENISTVINHTLDGGF